MAIWLCRIIDYGKDAIDNQISCMIASGKTHIISRPILNFDDNI